MENKIKTSTDLYVYVDVYEHAHVDSIECGRVDLFPYWVGDSLRVPAHIAIRHKLPVPDFKVQEFTLG